MARYDGSVASGGGVRLWLTWFQKDGSEVLLYKVGTVLRGINAVGLRGLLVTFQRLRRCLVIAWRLEFQGWLWLARIMLEVTHQMANVKLFDQSSVSFFFLPSLLGSGSPFFGSFFEPGSFSYPPPCFSYSLASLDAWTQSRQRLHSSSIAEWPSSLLPYLPRGPLALTTP